MANIRSNEVIEVYGGTAGSSADAITDSSAKDGANKLFEASTNAAGVKVAKFTISNGSNTGTGDVLDVAVLGSNATVLNLTINGAAALSSQAFSGTAPYLTFTNSTEENNNMDDSSDNAT